RLWLTQDQKPCLKRPYSFSGSEHEGNPKVEVHRRGKVDRTLFPSSLTQALPELAQGVDLDQPANPANVTHPESYAFHEPYVTQTPDLYPPEGLENLRRWASITEYVLESLTHSRKQEGNNMSMFKKLACLCFFVVFNGCNS